MASCSHYLDTLENRFNTTELPEALLYNWMDRIMIGCVLPLMCAVGLAGNMAFIFTILRVKWMRTVTTYYLTNLAVADIFFLLVVFGEKIIPYSVSELKGNMIFGQSGCIVTNYLRKITFFTSLFLVTLVSMERFYAVCRPLQHRMLKGKKRTVRLVAICWTVSACFASVLIPSSSVLCVSDITVLDTDKELSMFTSRKLQVCNSVSKTWTILSEGLFTAPFLITLVVNTVLYARIILCLHLRAASRSSKSTRNIKIRNQVARMLVINGSLFFLCLAPFQLTSLNRMVRNSLGLSSIFHSAQSLEKFLWTIRALVILNSVISPIVYTVTSPTYRHGFYVAFTCGNIEKRTNNK